MSPANKLLLPELHYIFNAAIILMLHQIVFVNLRTNDVSDIESAIEAFECEAAIGAAYASGLCRRAQRPPRLWWRGYAL